MEEVEVVELNVQKDHALFGKVSVLSFKGILKGKLAITLFERYPGLKMTPYCGNHFWSRGNFVATTVVNEEK